jgi:hypothetical protein
MKEANAEGCGSLLGVGAAGGLRLRGSAERSPAIGQWSIKRFAGGGVPNAREDVGQVLGWLDAVSDAEADQRVGPAKFRPVRRWPKMR